MFAINLNLTIQVLPSSEADLFLPRAMLESYDITILVEHAHRSLQRLPDCAYSNFLSDLCVAGAYCVDGAYSNFCLIYTPLNISYLGLQRSALEALNKQVGTINCRAFDP